jgi:hypothetical protein
MKRFTRTTGVLAIFVLMLTGAMANAQSGNKKAGDPPAPANEKKAKSTGNTPNAQVNPYFQESQNQGEMPAHNRRASEASQTQPTPGMQNAQSNPMYKDDKREGTNPLYERDSTARTKAPSTSATESHEVVEYKDNDDRVTRTRPGNNKTTKVAPPAGSPSSPAVVEYKDGEDGTMHTRPTNPK